MQVIRLNAEIRLKSGIVVVLEQGKGGELYLRRQGMNIVYGGISFDDTNALELWLATELPEPAKVELVPRPVEGVAVTLYEVAESKRGCIVHKAPEIDYPASLEAAAWVIAAQRRVMANVCEALRTKALNNPEGVKASTLEALADDLAAALN